MNLLIVDTTKKEAVLEAYANGVNFTHTIAANQKHNETLMLNIEQLLQTAKLSLSDINVFGCVTGPGSFTGIRIGMATVNAFSVALSKPIVSGNVFEVVSDFVQNGIMLLVSTSTSYYYANVKNGLVENYGVIETNNLETLLKNKPKVFCLQNEQESINFSYNNIETIKNYNFLLYQFFKNKAQSADYTKQHNFEPFYIQLSQAEREQKKVVQK